MSARFTKESDGRFLCVQGTKGENTRNLYLAHPGHVESPHQWHRQEQEHEICDYNVNTVNDDPVAEIDAPRFVCMILNALQWQALENRQIVCCYGHAYNHAPDDPKGDVEPTVWKDAAVEEDERKFHRDNTCCIDHLRCSCILKLKIKVSMGAWALLEVNKSTHLSICNRIF